MMVSTVDLDSAETVGVCVDLDDHYGAMLADVLRKQTRTVGKILDMRGDKRYLLALIVRRHHEPITVLAQGVPEIELGLRYLNARAAEFGRMTVWLALPKSLSPVVESVLADMQETVGGMQ